MSVAAIVVAVVVAVLLLAALDWLRPFRLWALLVAAGGGAAWLAHDRWSSLDHGQRVGAAVTLLVGAGAVVYRISNARRDESVRMRREKVQTPYLLGLFTLAAWGTTALTLTKPWTRPYTYPVLAALVALGLARETSKRTLRVGVIAIVVLAVFLVGAVGSERLREEAKDAASVQRRTIEDERDALRGQIERDLASTADEVCVVISTGVDAGAAPPCDASTLIEASTLAEYLRVIERQSPEVDAPAVQASPPAIALGDLRVLDERLDVADDLTPDRLLADDVRRLANGLIPARCATQEPVEADDEGMIATSCEDVLRDALDGTRALTDQQRADHLAVVPARRPEWFDDLLALLADIDGEVPLDDVRETYESVLESEVEALGVEIARLRLRQAEEEERPVTTTVPVTATTTTVVSVPGPVTTTDRLTGAKEALAQVERLRDRTDSLLAEPADFGTRYYQAQVIVRIREIAVARAQLVDRVAQEELDLLATLAAETTDAPPDGSAAAQELAEAQELAAAKTRAARTAADLAASEAALTRAREDLAGLDRPPVDVRIEELFGKGIDSLVAELPGRALVEEIDPTLGVIGAIVSVVLLILAYRGLEVMNNQRYGSPIHVEKVTHTAVEGIDKEDVDALTQRLKERILEPGLTQPGPSPGQATTAELSKILSETEDLGYNKLAGSILTFFQAAAFPPAGVHVRTAISEREDGQLEASIEVSTRVTERLVATATVVAESPRRLLDRVADFVAANALNFSQTVPAWTEWQDDGGIALGRFRAATSHTLAIGPDHSAAQQRTLLEEAFRASPINAPVRLALARLDDIEGARVRALRLHLETAIDHPTHLHARYRLATSMLMLARADQLQHWTEGGPRVDQIIDLLRRRYPAPPAWVRRAAGAEDGDWDSRLLGAASDPAAAARMLPALALWELTILNRWSKAPGLIWLSGRQAERSHWLTLLRSQRQQRQDRSSYRTVLLAAAIRRAMAGFPVRRTVLLMPGLESPGRWRVWARPLPRRRWDVPALMDRFEALTGWGGSVGPTAHYNAACIYADLAAVAGAGARAGARQRLAAWSGITRFGPDGRKPPNRDVDRPAYDDWWAHAHDRLVDRAFRHLEETLRRAGPSVVARAWLEADPDLVVLRQDLHRFQSLIDAFTTKPEGGDQA